MKRHGVKKGDRVTIYMPMIPEAAYAMLACTRIGAVHSIVFGGFSPDSLAGRINDCDSKFVITADEGVRAGKKIPLKVNTDEALKKAPATKSAGHPPDRRAVPFDAARDFWYHEEAAKVPSDCKPEKMKAEDPLFILYTSGSTGKPKGVLHTTGGYLVYASMTHQYIFDYHDGDIYWCTADVGWVTGHSYIVYGPLANGAITLMFEGVPNYPTNSRFWEVIDKHQVNTFYTAPTAIRALMGAGEDPVTKTSRKSLRLLGHGGRANKSGSLGMVSPRRGRWPLPIVDHMVADGDGRGADLAAAGGHKTQAGSATLPFFGCQPALVDEKGAFLEGATSGTWSFSIRGRPDATVYGDLTVSCKPISPPTRACISPAMAAGAMRMATTGSRAALMTCSMFRATALARRKSSRHLSPRKSLGSGGCRLSARHQGAGDLLLCHPDGGQTGSDDLRKDLVAHVRKEIGPFATPDRIQFAPGLPKTRSGKIMRRILRKIAEDDFGSLGDTSTLNDPTVVDDLIANRQNKKS